MKFYLASRGKLQQQCRDVSKQLIEMGHEVTSRCLDNDWNTNKVNEISIKEREENASKDLEDIDNADCLICFTQPYGSSYSKGGFHFEAGYAYGKGKEVIVVGWRENVFYYLPEIIFCLDVKELISTIKDGF